MKKDLESYKYEWSLWTKKPWYCEHCNCLLNIDVFPSCEGGYHPYKGVQHDTPYHKPISPERQLTFEEFCTILYNKMV
jgi:hypothetical protein